MPLKEEKKIEPERVKPFSPHPQGFISFSLKGDKERKFSLKVERAVAPGESWIILCFLSKKNKREEAKCRK